jgi:hypothetical protein
MALNTFEITVFDEGGPKKSRQKQKNLRLVCNTNNSEKIAIWGTDTVKYKNRKNVDTVYNAYLEKGFPVKIECETKPPKPDYKEKYGHTHWVDENDELNIL